MRKIKFLFLLCLFCMVSIGASAYSFSAKNADGVEIYYNITSSTKLTCEVTYGGTSYRSALYSGVVNIPASVTYNSKNYSVTSIGDHAFYDCSGLTSVTIPNSVTSIGGYAFEVCRGLTSVTIPNSVTSIGDYAFCWCEGLTAVNITDLDKWAEIAFNITANPLIYAHNLYLNGKLVTDAKLTTATKIGNDAFRGCTSLTSIEIPNSVTSIGGYAFENCSGLTSVTIPNSVTSIGICAFRDCTSLTSVTIPNSVTSIGFGTFYGCSGLTSVIIPNSVTSIGGHAFAYCFGLTSITIPNSVESIEDSTFYLCEGLKSIEIPNSVTSIGSGAFQGCVGLTSVTIPISVISIGDYAFSRCSSLEDVFVSRGRPYTISDNVFDTNDKGDLILITLHVPIGKTMVFQLADVWCKFYNIQEWDPSTGIEEVKSQSTDEVSPISSPEGKDLYNLQGQKVSVNGFRGIVIKNGKKYVVK